MAEYTFVARGQAPLHHSLEHATPCTVISICSV